MAAKTINTRIKNRVDSLANWQGEGVSLLPGEIALVRVTTQTVDEHGNIVDVPAVLMKVGESDGNGGTKAFDDLPWLSAIAADVYDWAKSASATEVPVTIGSTTSTLGAYLTQVNTNTSDISKNTAAIAKLNGDSDTAGSVAKAIADAIGALDGKNSGSSGTGKYVSKVVQTDGVVTTTYSSFPTASDKAAGITKLGVTGGAADHDAVFGTGTTTIATRLTTAEGDISNLKDAVAGGVHFRGTVTAAPSATTTTVNNVTISAGDVVIYSGKEYICTAVTDGKPSWEQLGDVTRIGNLETKINNLNVTTTNAVATTHKFVSQVTQSDGKVAITYTQPDATDVSFNDSINNTIAKKIAAMDSEIAGKALETHTHAGYINQHAFSTIKVIKSGGGASAVSVTADNATDIVEFSGTNIKITGTNGSAASGSVDKITFEVPDGSTEVKGIVQLSDSTASDASTTAATSKAVKAAYALASDANAALAGKSDTNHTHSSYVNQNAFSNIKVGSTTVAADKATDTVEFVGSNVTITPDATNNKVTFTVANGSTSAKGVVQLSDAVNSTSTSLAATANAVKKAYDLANSADAAAAAIEADYVRYDSDDKHMYVGTDGTDYIIFDCGGAAGWTD